MKQATRPMLASALLLSALACAKPESNPDRDLSPSSSTTPTAAQSDVALIDAHDADSIPTQAEADAAAAKKISADNAAEELKKLEDELGGG